MATKKPIRPCRADLADIARAVNELIERDRSRNLLESKTISIHERADGAILEVDIKSSGASDLPVWRP